MAARLADGMFQTLLNSHDGMFQALLNSQGYFCLFTPHSLTSQATNDLFIVGNVPRTKVSIQGVVQTISRIGVCSAQKEVFGVS